MFMNPWARVAVYVSLLDYILAITDNSMVLSPDYILELPGDLFKTLHAWPHSKPTESSSQGVGQSTVKGH